MPAHHARRRLCKCSPEPGLWLLRLAFTLHAFVIAALWTHVMPAFEARGVEAAAALAVLVWIGPAQVAGRLAFAPLRRALPLPGYRELMALLAACAAIAAG